MARNSTAAPATTTATPAPNQEWLDEAAAGGFPIPDDLAPFYEPKPDEAVHVRDLLGGADVIRYVPGQPAHNTGRASNPAEDLPGFKHSLRLAHARHRKAQADQQAAADVAYRARAACSICGVVHPNDAWPWTTLPGMARPVKACPACLADATIQLAEANAAEPVPAGGTRRAAVAAWLATNPT